MDFILLSLSISDFLMSMLVFPVTGWAFYWTEPDEFPIQHPLTQTRAFCALSLTSISSITVTILAYVKYVKISRGTNFDDVVTERRLRIAIALSWIVPLLVISLLPVLYIRIYRIYKESQNRIASTRTSTSSSNESATERASRKLIRKVLFITGAYFVCIFPTIPSTLLYRSGILQDGTVAHLVLIIFYGNSCVNPAIYFYNDRELFRIAKRLFMKTSVQAAENP